MEHILRIMDEIKYLHTLENTEFIDFAETYADNEFILDTGVELCYESYKFCKILQYMKNFMPLSPINFGVVFEKIYHIPFGDNEIDIEAKDKFTDFVLHNRSSALKTFYDMNVASVDSVDSPELYKVLIDKQIKMLIINELTPLFETYELNKYSPCVFSHKLKDFYEIYADEFDEEDLEFFRIISNTANFMVKIQRFIDSFRIVNFLCPNYDHDLTVYGWIFENSNKFKENLIAELSGFKNTGLEIEVSSELNDQISRYDLIINISSNLDLGDGFNLQDFLVSLHNIIEMLRDREQNKNLEALSFENEIHSLNRIYNTIDGMNDNLRLFYNRVNMICREIIKAIMKDKPRSVPILK